MELKSIQFLRGLAALLVVYAHTSSLTMNHFHSWQHNFYYLRNFGCIGVDIFFVISGFIISYIGNKQLGSNSAITFIKRRFLRINPTYYIASIIYLILLILPDVINHQKLPEAYVLNAVTDTITILPTTDTLAWFVPILVVGWTLSFEWFFYLIFSILIYFKTPNKIIWLNLIILTLIALGMLFTFEDFRIKFITNPIMLEFLFGVFLFFIYKKTEKTKNWIPIFLFSLAIISFLYLIFFGYGDVWFYKNTLGGKLSLQRSLIWGIPSCLLVASLLLFEKNGKLIKFLNFKPTLMIGNGSYSIYLFHAIVFQILLMMNKKTLNFFPPDISILLLLSIAIAGSLIFYRLIEKKLLDISRNIKNKTEEKEELVESETQTVLKYN